MASSIPNQTFATKLEQFDLYPTTNQALAQSMGANPDETKMVGTKAQKDSTMAQRLELFRAERLAPEDIEPTPQEAELKMQAQKLAGLGGLGRAIQNTVTSQFQQATATVPKAQVTPAFTEVGKVLGLTEEEVTLQKADPNSDYSKISTILNNFIQSAKGPNDAEAALKALDNLNLAAKGISSASAQALIGLTQQAIADQTGQALTKNIIDEIKIKDINLADIGLTSIMDISELLGITPEEAQELPVTYVRELVEQKRQAQFSRIDGLRAQLVAAPIGSKQREAILEELRDLGALGVTGMEAELAEGVNTLELFKEIKLGDKIYKTEDFLKDENLSQLIEDWIAATPEEKEKLIPSDKYPDLVKWIQDNQAALTQVSTTFGQTKKDYDLTQDANKNLYQLPDLDLRLNDSLMKLAIPGWDPSKAVTKDELDALKTAFNATSLGQVISGTLPKADKKTLVNKINQLPEDVQKSVLALPATDIDIASKAADELMDTPELAAFLGLTSKNGFVLDEAQQDLIALWKPTIAEIKEKYPEWLEISSQKILKTLTPEDIKLLLADPRRFDNLKLSRGKAQEYKNIKDMDQALQFVTGSTSADLVSINKQYLELQKWAQLGDKNSQAALDYFGNTLGLYTKYDLSAGYKELSHTDFSRIMDHLAQYQDLDSDVIKGAKPKVSSLMKLAEDFTFKMSPNPQEELRSWADKGKISDGRLTLSDFTGMSDTDKIALGEFVDKNPQIKVNLGGYRTYKEWRGHRDEVDALDDVDAIFSNSGLVDLDDYETGKTGFSGGGMYTPEYLTNLQKAREIISAKSLETKNSLITTSIYKTILDDINITIARIEEGLRKPAPVGTVVHGGKATKYKNEGVDVKVSKSTDKRDDFLRALSRGFS